MRLRSQLACCLAMGITHSLQLQVAARPKPSALSGVSDKTQVGAPNRSAPKFPTIYFTANSAEVPSSSNPLLLQATRLIKQLPAGTLVEITGYTHNIGSPTTSMQLSQRRANAVRRALVHSGVDPTMLTAKGYGSSHSLPLASQNGTVEGRSNGLMEDRRVMTDASNSA